MVAKDLNEVNAFLDNLPTAPCHIKRPEALCSLCEKLNNDVYRACQERDRDENGMLLDVGDFTDVGTASEDTGAPAKEEAEEPQALVRKVSDTVAIEFLRPSTPPEPEARGPEVPTPPAMPPKPAPPESPSAPPAGPVEATPPDLDSMAPKERAPLPEEKIEVRDKTTGLSIEFVPKKKHFKAKPKDTLWEEIMSEALFRGIVDEFVPPTEPEAAETPSEATEAPAGPGEAPDAGVEMPAPAPAEAPIGDISTTVGTGVEAEPIEVVVVEIETVEAGGEAGEVLEPEILEVEVLVEEEVPTTPVLGSGFEVQMQQVREGRYEEALAGFEAVLAGDPDNVDARVGRGHVLRLLSRYEEALAAFDSVLAIDPGRADAAAEREKVLEHMKMTDFAQVKDRADSLFKEGQYDDALVLYDRAIELSTNDIHVLNNKALTLRALQRFEEAREVYEEILGIDPENLKARKGLERTNLAIAELREGTTVAPVTPESLDVTAPAPEVEGAPAEAAPKAPVRAKKVRINRERAEEFRRKRAAEAREGTEAGTPPTEAPGETAGPGAEAAIEGPAGEAAPEAGPASPRGTPPSEGSLAPPKVPTLKPAPTAAPTGKAPGKGRARRVARKRPKAGPPSPPSGKAGERVPTSPKKALAARKPRRGAKPTPSSAGKDLSEAKESPAPKAPTEPAGGKAKRRRASRAKRPRPKARPVAAKVEGKEDVTVVKPAGETAAPTLTLEPVKSGKEALGQPPERPVRKAKRPVPRRKSKGPKRAPPGEEPAGKGKGATGGPAGALPVLEPVKRVAPRKPAARKAKPRPKARKPRERKEGAGTEAPATEEAEPLPDLEAIELELAELKVDDIVPVTEEGSPDEGAGGKGKRTKKKDESDVPDWGDLEDLIGKVSEDEGNEEELL